MARAAEEAGFDAIFTTEVNNDAMATAQLMGASTQRIQVGTWIANIYARHSYTCAKGAELIADATDGRFILGLGVSHQPVNAALGIDMTNAPEDLRNYVREVRNWLRGEGPTTHLPQHPAARHVPIYVAALSLGAVERAAELADGIMPPNGHPSGSPKARTGRPVGGPGHRNSAPSTSPWGSPRSSVMISTSCVAPPGRTWPSTPTTPTSSACMGPAASPPKPI